MVNIMLLRKKKLTILIALIIVFVLTISYILFNPLISKPKGTKFEDISEIIEKVYNKEELTSEEYLKLSIQTGLSKTSIEVFLTKYNPDYLLKYQEDHIYNTKEIKSSFFIGSYQLELVNNHLPFIDIKDGDVLITSTSHTFGYRHGHSGIVIEADKALTLESYTPFVDSKYDKLYTWLAFKDVMVLRLKEEYRHLIPNIIEFAKNKLVGVKYSLLASTKDKISKDNNIKRTQCSHLVWAAFYSEGIDLNSDGSWLVTANDISRSSYLEVVEVKGFNYLELW